MLTSTMGTLNHNEARREELASLHAPIRTQETNRSVFRLRSRGWLDRENDLYLTVPKCMRGRCNVIFFPGDVQDFHASIRAGRFAEFRDFSYEAVAKLLCQKFGPTCNVWIVRPRRFKHGAYSSYDNFVATNEYGAAIQFWGGKKRISIMQMLFVLATKTDDATGDATKHLASLMQNTQATLRQQGGFVFLNVVHVSTALPMHLLGFSKGGTVLNQLVTELVRYSLNKKRSIHGQIRQGSVLASTRQFFSAVRGRPLYESYSPAKTQGWYADHFNALVRLWKRFIRRQLRLYVHVTPYQYEARMTRPWVKTEVNTFVHEMSLYGTDIQLIMYVDSNQGARTKIFVAYFTLSSWQLLRRRGKFLSLAFSTSRGFQGYSILSSETRKKKNHFHLAGACSPSCSDPDVRR
ncbi:hypothetical protein PsorP6_006703 [Peronosclerospora sorghi]|uniref:Uncharacterized protein n=1 Tax=Peronosclerospora sorghi TaxID=230839 RepID=A0ACC0W1D1_9STRA|nr:hypothetical protein PsorP6_006703 [Peronosclerospora sorghi]